MEKNELFDLDDVTTLSFDQLKKYAVDMGRIYQSEKNKRKDLEIAKDKLQESYRETINRLVIASEYRDEDTGDHVVRMAAYCALIAEKHGLPEAEVEQIHIAAPMHDVGKIGIPDGILLKPGKLTSEEFETIKSHTLIGAKILEGSSSEILRLATEIALTHHEKWNGKGYPNGLSGTAIPIAGRIVAIADVFDALTSKRPYKDAFPVEVACDIIKKERGEHFDPELADVFLNNMDVVLKIKAKTTPAGEK
uniref:HD domain-containing protein n=1 Tax=Candidatus Desulfatibia profunda TaxID=2841695 RepID=A0A8J6TNA9_9BACT|nr:HD domain-containing protein [Candidatus Desulfatibia profunda]